MHGRARRATIPETTRLVDAEGAATVPRQLTIDAPLDCTIRAGGARRAVGGPAGRLRVRPSGEGSDSPVTELSGTLLDQGALVGVLVTLYDLGLPLLSVACAWLRAGADGGSGPPAGQADESEGRWEWQP